MTLDVTPEQLASYIRQNPDTWDGTRAVLCLDGARSAVVEYCGWHIAPVLTETVTVDGSGTTVQPLPTLNLMDLSAVTENGETLDPDEIDWSTYGVLEKRAYGRWTRRRRGVTAVITHGYEQTPSWVVTLICAVAARGLLTAPGIVREEAGGESITYGANVPTGVVALLNVERRMLDRIRVPAAA